jgi:hypothetical protein
MRANVYLSSIFALFLCVVCVCVLLSRERYAEEHTERETAVAVESSTGMTTEDSSFLCECVKMF